MKTTGIVRRIDELGRVVIPKEIRRTMHLKEGEEMEVYVDEDDTLVLKKYSAMKSFAELGQEYADIMKSHTGYNCIICDTDFFIAAAVDKDLYISKRITKSLENFLKLRKSGFFRGSDAFSINGDDRYSDMAIAPIVVGGDVVGGIILVAKTSMNMPETQLKLLEVGAGIFAKQIE
jgi:AbrB family transcriptional regulator (stage V sporulation protein T)